jgi:hypothetical protein
MAQGVSGQWKEGAVVLNDGRTLEGQAQGQTYKGNDVQSLLYRKEKGTHAVTNKADDYPQVIYDGLNVVACSVPAGGTRGLGILVHRQLFA